MFNKNKSQQPSKDELKKKLNAKGAVDLTTEEMENISSTPKPTFPKASTTIKGPAIPNSHNNFERKL